MDINRSTKTEMVLFGKNTTLYPTEIKKSGGKAITRLIILSNRERS